MKTAIELPDDKVNVATIYLFNPTNMKKHKMRNDLEQVEGADFNEALKILSK